jgi:hypothetical protein
MSWPLLTVLGFTLIAAITGNRAFAAVRRRHVHRWIGPCIRRSLAPRRATPVHALICIADHFEPSWGGGDPALGETRVRAWTEAYPRVFGRFADSDGRPPRHTFFYPIDQYRPSEVDSLSRLCRAGFGEVEVHLHHDGDTAQTLRQTLDRFTRLLAHRHGVLGRWPDGRTAFGFVHGNWALCNARRDGRWCGVNDELSVLREAGCFADFTMPSAPDPTQVSRINSIYYATSSARAPRSHERGLDVGPGPVPAHALMLIQGPLVLRRPPGRLLPRIENGCLQLSQPPDISRLEAWLRAGIGVRARPDWAFIKLHTHGATEANQRVLLGDAMVRFHESLARRAKANPAFRFHYVTAREVYNLARAAAEGWTGEPGGAMDWVIRTHARSDSPRIGWDESPHATAPALISDR